MIAYTKTLLVLIVLGGFVCLPQAMASQTQFFETAQDLPLMSGLEELHEQTVSFDKPAGRIVQLWAYVGMQSQDDVTSYYDASLPQFGWAKRSDNVFIRGQESLVLEFETLDEKTYLKIEVGPR